MQKKELNTIRGKKIDELKKEVDKIKLEKDKSKIDIIASKEKNLKKVKNLTRDLSQILTIIREKEIVEQANNKKQGKEEKS